MLSLGASKVIAVEPHPDSFAHLKERFADNVLSGLSYPLPALCYEYAIEFEDEALACAKLLQALGEYEFNFAEGQNEEFIFLEWMTDEEEFFDEVRQVPCTDWAGLLWGDVYARLRNDD
jgi:hypothetical protein